MTGLEKIVEQILEDANARSDEILAAADKEAAKIIDEAKIDAARMKTQSDEKRSMEKKSGELRAQSSADLKKRQTILKAKQEIIGGIIEKAYDRIINMDDKEYFSMMEKLVAANASSKSGEICLSARDLKRKPADFDKNIADIAAECGGSLKVSKTAVSIDGGFVLVYGGIEENCSVKAMFDANRERLADKVNSLLFAGGK